MATLIERVLGAARLDPGTYEDVEADAGALGQAMTVVVVAAIAGGIGLAGVGEGDDLGLVGGTIASLLGWFVWAFVVYLVGTRLLPGPDTQADLGQLLRTTGFAASPGIIRILGIVPGIGGLVMAVLGRIPNERNRSVPVDPALGPRVLDRELRQPAAGLRHGRSVRVLHRDRSCAGLGPHW